MTYPLLSLANQTPKFISVDGGTATVGLCHFTLEDGKMRVLDTHLINANNLPPRYHYAEERKDSLFARLLWIEKEMNRYISNKGHISTLVYESHFFNPRRPTSALPLVRFMKIVEDITFEHGITMVTVAPQQMKRAINVSGKLSKADKEVVYHAIKRLIHEGKILLNDGINPALLSEHEIDAIGLGYTQLTLDHLI